MGGIGTELVAGSLDESGQEDATTPSKAIQSLAKQVEVIPDKIAL
jgi:tRNA A37 threonylcarbamoyladenosine synthetase subunit TsaC/SUA5/YrdC